MQRGLLTGLGGIRISRLTDGAALLSAWRHRGFQGQVGRLARLIGVAAFAPKVTGTWFSDEDFLGFFDNLT